MCGLKLASAQLAVTTGAKEMAPFCVGMWKPASQCRRTSLQMFGLEMGTDSGFSA